MKDKILKNIFIFIVVALMVIPLTLGIYGIIVGANDPWSGTPLNAFESFLTWGIFIYLFYCWPYIIIALLYTVIYTIYYRKTELVKKFLKIVGIILFIILIISCFGFTIIS